MLAAMTVSPLRGFLVTGQMPFLLPNQQRQSTEGTSYIIYSKFHRDPFRGRGVWCHMGQNLAIPITLATGFYNSLYYHTSHDLLCLRKTDN